MPEQQRRARQWIGAGNDHTLRLDYDLVREDVVLDLGGYEGQWASDIFSRYCCIIHVFEPAPQFAARISQRFSRNPRIHVHEFGLASANGVACLGLEADRSSTFMEARKAGRELVEIRLVEAKRWIEQADLDEIGLMKINIEGGEYDLLDHLLAEDLLARVRDIQIQFHDFVPHAEERMLAIERGLEMTHAITYQSKFVWENWRRRQA